MPWIWLLCQPGPWIPALCFPQPELSSRPGLPGSLLCWHGSHVRPLLQHFLNPLHEPLYHVIPRGWSPCAIRCWGWQLVTSVTIFPSVWCITTSSSPGHRGGGREPVLAFYWFAAEAEPGRLGAEGSWRRLRRDRGSLTLYHGHSVVIS